ncbi:unnamed protein product [Closterium sp. NIES-54]
MEPSSTNTRDLSTNKFIGEITGLPTSLIHLCVPPSSHFSRLLYLLSGALSVALFPTSPFSSLPPSLDSPPPAPLDLVPVQIASQAGLVLPSHVSNFPAPATASHICLNRLSQLCSCTCVTLFLPPLLPGSPSPSPLPPRSSPSAPPFLLSAPPYPPPPCPGACSITSSQGPSLPTSPPSPSSPTCACASPAPHAYAHATSNHPSSPLYVLHVKPPLRLTLQTPDPKLC